MLQFVDNQDVLDLIEGKMGILDLVDEQCRCEVVPAEAAGPLKQQWGQQRDQQRGIEGAAGPQINLSTCSCTHLIALGGYR